jgi:hypothetical protein
MSSVARFWRETIRRYNLGASRCMDCKEVFFPPRAVCPHCSMHRRSLGRMELCQLSGEGEVFSYTVVHEPAEGFEMEVPYVLALVKMAEGPILTAQLVDVEPEDVELGMSVKAVFRELKEEGPEGVIHYGYKFAPKVPPGSTLPPNLDE